MEIIKAEKTVKRRNEKFTVGLLEIQVKPPDKGLSLEELMRHIPISPRPCMQKLRDQVAAEKSCLLSLTLVRGNTYVSECFLSQALDPNTPGFYCLHGGQTYRFHPWAIFRVTSRGGFPHGKDFAVKLFNDLVETYPLS